MERLPRIITAAVISLALHALFLVAAWMQMESPVRDPEAVVPITLLPSRRPMDPEESSGSPVGDTVSPQSLRTPEPAGESGAADSTGTGSDGVASEQASQSDEDPPVETSFEIPEWRIDTPPKITEAGTMAGIADINALLDAMPLTAFVHLDADGRPYLILYKPFPEDSVRRWLNSWFETASFSPGLVRETPVPSCLEVPMRLSSMADR